MQQAEVAVAETAEETIQRLGRDNDTLRARLNYWQGKIGRLAGVDMIAKVFGQENVILNQKVQLRQLNGALWRRKEANRKLREERDRLRAHVKAVSRDFYDEWYGPPEDISDMTR